MYAGATPYRSPGGDAAPVIPGGFGAGTPARQHPTPALSHRSLSRGISRSSPVNPYNPWLNEAGAEQFSMPAAAVDQGFGSPSGWNIPQAGGVMHPWGAGPAGAEPPMFSMPSPRGSSWSMARTHEQDPGEGEDDLPPALEWSPGANAAWDRAWGQSSPNQWKWDGKLDAWGQSNGSSPSPSASVINGFASGPRSQYKRPEDWRQGFSMSKPGALTRVFSIGKGKNGSGFSLFNKPSVHWTLDVQKARCTWDVRKPPGHFLVLPDHRPLSYLELQEGAMSPPPLRMKLVHPKLPWTIHVAAGPGEVITVAHLLATVHAELNRQIFQQDFWNDDLSEHDRKRVHDAWSSRSGGDRAIAEQGIKRVDFLCDRYVFEGIKRVGEVWEMKLKSGRRYM
ncbi:uncharacterized protein FOMMEDRAFT_23033 [Fomitiporia mediterranea MF3/22]|uniref:uncharacterized protein n=1 Tax=Fomitiporia mediterranea (strain MF3/22) TaxID=694068 RepID=UPI0004408B9F|nr:uncharacterized protein FOMMEDRAFT_23033 [Fomitiporia mediterranea MF3/22]EJC99118.1 hypothetical protein FOMMEDRAFT_23033 [Fomitiporia mediterranea MF3/22]